MNTKQKEPYDLETLLVELRHVEAAQLLQRHPCGTLTEQARGELKGYAAHLDRRNKAVHQALRGVVCAALLASPLLTRPATGQPVYRASGITIEQALEATDQLLNPRQP